MSNPKIRLRRGTAAQVNSYASNAVAGEIVVDTQTPRLYFCAPDGTLVGVANYSELSGGGTGADIVLTGYSIASTAAAVAATDTINQGIGKLEKRVSDLETIIDGGTLT
jgi:hypothetical protein